MSIFEWGNKKIQKMNFLSMGIFKICLISFSFMIAVLIPEVLLLEWYWYGLIFLVSYIYILVVIFKK
ncbi:hypothetical protein K9M42_00100 [Patescibacteria group bacterium]|nr:hypothetical protein [Patescibacteria group bacterium]